MAESNVKKNKKRLVGIVLSDKMDKSRVVVVECVKKHTVYGKFLTKRKKFMVHDEKNKSKIGNHVIIEETKPISSKKRWAFVKIVDTKK